MAANMDKEERVKVLEQERRQLSILEQERRQLKSLAETSGQIKKDNEHRGFFSEFSQTFILAISI